MKHSYKEFESFMCKRFQLIYNLYVISTTKILKIILIRCEEINGNTILKITFILE